MTRWLVTGAGGALGQDLVVALTGMKADVVGLDRRSLDITDATGVRHALEQTHPDVVLNAAAYTRVDDAESDEDEAGRVNAEGPGHLARWCATNGARLIHVSTDYVFPGDAHTPYETDAATGPNGAYGRTKLAGEQSVLEANGDCHVVRTGWLYGAGGPSFIRAVGRRLNAGEAVDVVTDQRGAPTWTSDLALRLIALGSTSVPPGVWHCSAAGEATWFDVAVSLAESLGVPVARVRPTTSATMKRPAPRPAYSVLSSRKWLDAGLPAMPHWQTALTAAIGEHREALTG